MAVADFIVAIELGSTEITGIAGKKNADGSIRILASSAEKSADCIKKGIIYNIDKTMQCITSVIRQLEDKLDTSIKKAYIGIGGLSLRTVHNTVQKKLPEETKISQALIDLMMDENKSLLMEGHEILSVVSPQEYKIGNNHLTTEPVGIPTDRIEGHYLNVIARDSVKSNIRQCFRQAGYEVADYLLSPVATADAVLTPNEKRSGCALVDFGADTTTVSVYKNNVLKHLAVIPLGGSNITKDIASLQMGEDNAEQLKIRFAKAYIDPEDSEEEMKKEYSLDGEYSIHARDLDNIVAAREKEIIENVWNQIKLSDYSDKLMAGVVFTGGAAKLPNIDKAFAAATQIDQIRIAQNTAIELHDAPLTLRDGTHNTLIGLLKAGKDNCRKIDPNSAQTNFLDDMEEAERRKREEEARREAERKQREAEEAAARAAEERRRAKEEAERKRLEQYESLIEEAKALLNQKRFKDARLKVEKAQACGIDGKEDETANLLDKIKREKSANSTWGKLVNKLKEGAEELTKE